MTEAPKVEVYDLVDPVETVEAWDDAERFQEALAGAITRAEAAGRAVRDIKFSTAIAPGRHGRGPAVHFAAVIVLGPRRPSA